MPRRHGLCTGELVAAVALGAELGAEVPEARAGDGTLGVGHGVAVEASVGEGTVGGVLEAAEVLVAVDGDVRDCGLEIWDGSCACASTSGSDIGWGELVRRS